MPHGNFRAILGSFVTHDQLDHLMQASLPWVHPEISEKMEIYMQEDYAFFVQSMGILYRGLKEVAADIDFGNIESVSMVQ